LLPDRIDINARVPAVAHKGVRRSAGAGSSAGIRARAVRARRVRQARAPQPASAAFETLSARHVPEAVQYRGLDRNYRN
jgi:hypothetical protein